MANERKRHKSKPTRYPGVRRIASGRYIVRTKVVHPKTGKPKEFQRIVLAESDAHASAIRATMRAEFLRDHQPEAVPTLRVFAGSWLNTKLPSIKASTADRYATTLDHICAALGDYYIDRITVADVAEWRDQQRATSKPRTVNSRLRVFRTLMADAQQQYLLPVNAARGVPAIRIPKTDVDDENYCLEPADLARLLEGIRTRIPQWYAMSLTLAFTGQRFSACAALKWSDVDFERGAITVRRSHYRGILDGTKTGTVRTVPMGRELAAVLRQHRRRQMASQAPGLDEGWVFPSTVGTLRNADAFNRPVGKVCASLGIDPPVTSRWFRHTLSNLVRQTAGRQVQKAITGHTTDRMAEHYSHVSLNDRAEAAREVVSKVVAIGLSLDGQLGKD